MKGLSVVVLFLGAVTFLMPGTAEAKSNFPSKLPNGTVFSCGLCHQGGRGGAPLTVFGRDADRNMVSRIPSWAALVDLDSDGDGLTNGEELGDPEGLWSVGDPNPVADLLSDPNDPNDPGDGSPDPEPDPDAGGGDAGEGDAEAPGSGDSGGASSEGCAVSPGQRGGVEALVMLGLLGGVVGSWRRR